MMYAKFVIYDETRINGNVVSDRDGNSEEERFPCISEVFSGRRMGFMKVRILSKDQFYNEHYAGGYSHILTNIPDLESNEINFEILILRIYNENDEPINSYIAAADTVLFIMNENGKTIDKIACRNDH